MSDNHIGMIIHWLVLFIVLITVVFTSFSFASPFDSFEKELKDYIKSDTYQYYDGGEQSQIDRLFSQDVDVKQHESRSGGYSKTSSNIRLPSTIPVKRIISTKIIEPTKRSSGYRLYQVKKRDTLNQISKKYHVSVNSLRRANGIKGHIIRTGSILKVPGGKMVAASPGKEIIKYRVFAKPVVNGRYTSSFGYRKDPFNNSRRNYHSGVDISAAVGTPVIAAADGVVVFLGRNGGYGNTIRIRHKGGYDTHYAHCATTTVKLGQHVKMGTVVGSVGRTGTATGAHLHFEVRYRGRYINPKRALNKVHVVVRKFSGKRATKKKS
ncbi:MAG: peptidoglycan DD-metalloendopeptidase family protein [Leptospiraceae bacterium]|nr:peptidoglycan DD-metalloendopeptidase family protein [Leptospiraceae bacterium]